jgi:hypothetical protein
MSVSKKTKKKPIEKEEFFIGVCNECGNETVKVSSLVIKHWTDKCKIGSCDGRYTYIEV